MIAITTNNSISVNPRLPWPSHERVKEEHGLGVARTAEVAALALILIMDYLGLQNGFLP
jgi:hypothetical protein